MSKFRIWTIVFSFSFFFPQSLWHWNKCKTTVCALYCKSCTILNTQTQGSCKLRSENIAHLCLRHYKQWQDVLNNLFSQIRLTSWSSTICSLTPKGQKKSVFCVLLQDTALAIDIHCPCHHEGCGALLELLFFGWDTRLDTALLIIKQQKCRQQPRVFASIVLLGYTTHYMQSTFKGDGWKKLPTTFVCT